MKYCFVILAAIIFSAVEDSLIAQPVLNLEKLASGEMKPVEFITSLRLDHPSRKNMTTNMMDGRSCSLEQIGFDSIIELIPLVDNPDMAFGIHSSLSAKYISAPTTVGRHARDLLSWYAQGHYWPGKRFDSEFDNVPQLQRFKTKLLEAVNGKLDINVAQKKSTTKLKVCLKQGMITARKHYALTE